MTEQSKPKCLPLSDKDSKCPKCGRWGWGACGDVPGCPNAPKASEAPKCYHCETCSKQCATKTGQKICCNCKQELAPAPVSDKGAEVDFEAAANYANCEWWALKPPATVCDAREGNLARAYLALRARLADVEAERDQYREILESKDEHIANLNGMRDTLRAEVETFRKDSQFWKNQVKDLEGDRAELAAAREEIERRGKLILEAGGRENGLRADLQLAREEIATLETIRDKNVFLQTQVWDLDASCAELKERLAAEKAAREDERITLQVRAERAERALGEAEDAREKAEARVRELEDIIAAKSEGDAYRDNDGCLPSRLRGRSKYEVAHEAFEAEAERILATRQKEESNA